MINKEATVAEFSPDRNAWCVFEYTAGSTLMKFRFKCKNKGAAIKLSKAYNAGAYLCGHSCGECIKCQTIVQRPAKKI